MKKIITFLFVVLSIASNSIAQNIADIKGKVLYQDKPIVHATVKVASSKEHKTTQSDRNGFFEFVINRDFPITISISHIGFKDTTLIIETIPQNTIEIALRPINTLLNEVMVSTGIHKIPKERATGSFDLIDNDLFNRQSSTDVLSRLDGIASSVMFDNRPNVGGNNLSIRGLSTIYSNTRPLIILNNFPYEGDINNINPNDVENITILKDATASSIWGARAGNGVIVITTKKGGKNQKATIAFNANTTFIQKPDMMQLPYMSSLEYIGVEKMLFDNSFYNANEQLGYVPLSPAVELMYKNKRGLLSDEDLQLNLNELGKYDIRRDLNKYVYRHGVNQQYSLNVSGQEKNINYYLSGGYDNNTSTIDGRYKRYNLKSDNSFRLTDKLSLDAALFFTNTLNETGRPTSFSAIPYMRIADDNGNALAIDRYYRSSYVQTVEAKGLLNWEYRPLDELNLVNNKQKTNSLIVNTGLNYDIGKGLNAELKYQYENAQGVGKDIRSVESYYTRDMINNYTQVGQGSELFRAIPLGDILHESTNNFNSQSLRLQLNYTKTWNRNQLTGLVGTEARQATTTTSQSSQYGYNPNILTTAAVNYDLDYKLYNPRGGISKIPRPYGMSETNDRFTSIFSNWAYTYDSRYNLNISARQDGSNLFGVKSNQKFTPLWSIGGSWHLTNEQFMNIAWIDLLKLRTTFGYSGNLNRNVSALPIMRYESGGNLINTPYGVLVNPPNENLRWERNQQFNLGIDFNILNQRLSGTLEYYHKKNTDLIGYMPIDQTTGAMNPVSSRGFSYLGNSASMVGNGVDVQLQSINIRKAFTWQTNLLYSKVNTKITEYLAETRVLDNYINGGLVVSPIIGKPVYSIYALRWAGLDPETGAPMGFLHGEISKDYVSIRNETTPEDLVYYGSATPTHFGSLRNTFSWRGLSLSLNISYKLGFYFRRNSVFYNAIFNGTGTHSDFSLRWQKPGDELITNVPSMMYPNDPNRDGFFYPRAEVLISKGDNIRLQDINLSYQMKAWREKLKMQRLEVFMYATNLGILWKSDNHKVDPEFGNLSPLRTISLGLKAGF